MHQLSTVHFTGVVVPPVISLQCIHRCHGPSSHLTAVHLRDQQSEQTINQP